jgi:ribosomal protein L44E
MPCHWLRMPDGSHAIVKLAKRRVTWCKFCLANGGRKTASTKLCDHELPNGKTCDAAMCDKHAASVGEDRDLCPVHKGATVMAEHYTKNTVQVQAYCNKCRRQTSHRVNGGRKGSCLECVAKLEKEHAARANEAPPAEQSKLF